jgi:circadian clock protein KaiB
MEPRDILPSESILSNDVRGAIRLRLYVARSTPNSVRAEANLAAVLGSLKSEHTIPTVEIVDVFSQPKRAVIDGVIVTPTLIGFSYEKRIILMGDLSDRSRLESLIQDLLL